MSWIIYSASAFLFSVILYLFVRKASEEGLTVAYKMLAFYMIPLVSFITLVIVQGLSIDIGLTNIIYIFLVAFFTQYVAGKLSLKAIDMAPNPGYSLILSKSSVVITSIASVFLFNSELGWKQIISILIILAFSALVTIDPDKTTRKKNSKWLIYSVIVLILWAIWSLFSKYIGERGVNPAVTLMYVCLFVTLSVLVEMIRDSSIKKFQQQNWGLLFLTGISTAIFYLSLQFAFKAAPNVGYVNAVNASSIAALTVASGLIFKDDLNKRKLLGVFGVTAGLLLLVL
jgi:drug/metabolite transporter (DMT)-like permease